MARKTKKYVFELLKLDDFDAAMSRIASMKKASVVNHLISALCNSDSLIKWRAVSALGKVVAGLAEEDMEKARIIMRRFMWMLNDESGGIGWGVPESMAEIMACHGGLANEYAQILVSYLREDANFLEYEPLQRGLLWGIGRLGSVRRQKMMSLGVEKYLPGFLNSDDLEVIAMAIWAVGIFGIGDVRDLLLQIMHSAGNEKVLFYNNWVLRERSITDFVNEALRELEGPLPID